MMLAPRGAIHRSRLLITGGAAAVLLGLPLFVWQAATSPLLGAEFVPHGICLLWDPALIRLFVGSDTLIGLSYTAISGTLAYFIQRTRREVPFQWVFIAFAIFIVACGATHFADVLTLYVSNYWLSGSVKFVTAIASVVTAVALPPLVPRAIRLVETAKLAEARRVELQAAHRQLEAAHQELAAMHRQLEGEYAAQRERLAAIVEGSEDAIIGRDLEGRVTTWNPAAERLLGYAPHNVIGRRADELLPADRAGELDVLAARVAAGEHVPPVETARVRRDGTQVDVSLSLSPIRDGAGRAIGYATILRDITERKRLEAERQALLEQERAARGAAEAALRARDEFLSVAAHELKTPLTGVLAGAQVALRRVERSGELTADEARRALGAIERQAIKSSRLVTQLFDLAQLESGKLTLHLEPLDVAQVVEQAVGAARATGDAHTVRVERGAEAADPHAPLMVQADPVRLEQVLTALLDNAIRYSPGGGEISVAVEPVAGTDASGTGAVTPGARGVRIVIADRGLGVPLELRPRLFERYGQGHATDHRSGLGLGLHLSREIVERHGGRLTAEFPPEGGTCMAIVLPLLPQRGG